MTQTFSTGNNGKGIFWPNILMDFVLLGCYYFLLDPLLQWQDDHLALSGVIMMILNTAASAIGIITFFGIYNAEHELKNYSMLMNSFEGAVIGVSALLTFIGMLWWLIPVQAINQTGSLQVYNSFSMLAYFLICLGVMSKAIDSKKMYAFSKTKKAGWISLILNSSFFFFSYALLIVSLRNWDTSHFLYDALGMLGIILFYLPLRIFLLLRPPFHNAELISLLISFMAMVIQLYSSI